MTATAVTETASNPNPGGAVTTPAAQDAPAGQQQTQGDTAQPKAAAEPTAPAAAPAAAADATKPASEPSKADDAKPEQYALKNPDGSPLDEQVLGSYADVARELGVKPDVAQTMLDRVAPVIAERQAQRFQALKDGWQAELKADPEVGGTKLAETETLVAKVLDSIPGGKEVRTLLNESGLGQHKAIAKLFRNIGSRISDDSFSGGDPAAVNDPRAWAKNRYPKSEAS